MTKEEAILKQTEELTKTMKQVSEGNTWLENHLILVKAERIKANIRAIRHAEPRSEIEILRVVEK